MTGHVEWGYGVGRYAINTISQTAWIDATNSPNSFQELHSFVGNVAYQHWWNNQWRSTILYGFVFNNTNLNTPAVVRKWIQSGVVNLFYSPAPIVRLGIEWIYGEARFTHPLPQSMVGQRGRINRIEAQARLYF